MSLLYFLIWVITLSLAIWLIGSYISKAWLEEPDYTVILEENGYEIRHYSPYIVAEIEVKWTYSEALNSGFRNLAGYIFGWNTKKQSLQMTSPVIQKRSEKIRMTSPVIDISNKTSTRTVQFVMPREYSLENLPTPNDTRVQLREIPARKVVALRFTWWITEKRAEQKKLLLSELLRKENYAIIWDFLTAQYNPPFSFPLMRRNEILVEIE